MGGPDTHREELEGLKIEALTWGCRVTDLALGKLGGTSALTRHEYATTGGIPCRVGDIYLNIPFDEWFVSNSRLVLDVDEVGPVLKHRDLTFRIDDIFPLPGYVGRPTSTGHPLDDVVFSHMDRARVSPITGCAYDCAFCDLPGRIVLRPFHVLTEAIRTALDDTTLPVRHLLISGGSPGPRQREAFADTLVGLIEAFKDEVPVDVMMSTGPETPALVERLVAAGVHGLSLNIEAFSVAGSEEHLPAKHRRARPHFDETVTTAVSLLGKGRVRSLIIPGLEPRETTIAGVQHLSSLGVDPVLSPFRPAQGTRRSDRQPVSPADLSAVLDASRSIVADAGVRLGPRCIPCQHNTLTFPWDVA